VLEVIEITSYIYPGLYGAPGSIVGPQQPANLAALQGASPAILAGTVANYYTITTNPWWAGDYVVLGDSSHAYWTGTAWAAGAAPNSGAGVRPVFGTFWAGAPGYTTPLGALAPAPSALNNAAVQATPAVAWKVGDYVIALDGSFWHTEWTVVGGHPLLVWVSGVATLSVLATRGQLGFIQGYLPKWALSDGSSGVAPANLPTLQSSSIFGYAQGGAFNDRPWNPAGGVLAETLHCYDNTRVAWLGSDWSIPTAGTSSQQVAFPINVSVQQNSTGDAFTTTSKALGVATTRTFYRNNPGSTSGPDDTPIALPQGWYSLAWPFSQVTAGVAWTNAAGDNVTWQPASAVDPSLECGIYTAGPSSPGWVAGTALALFVNGTERCRVTADGTTPFLIFSAMWTSLAATDKIEFRVYSPVVGQQMKVSGTNVYWYYCYPYMTIAQSRAIASGAGLWQVGTAGHYGITGSMTIPGDYFSILRNGMPIGVKNCVSDSTAINKLQIDLDLAVGDTICLYTSGYRFPASKYYYYFSGSPRLTLARWKVF
jgi:hypothetical protein